MNEEKEEFKTLEEEKIQRRIQIEEDLLGVA